MSKPRTSSAFAPSRHGPPLHRKDFGALSYALSRILSQASDSPKRRFLCIWKIALRCSSIELHTSIYSSRSDRENDVRDKKSRNLLPYRGVFTVKFTCRALTSSCLIWKFSLIDIWKPSKPTTAQRCRSGTETNIFRESFQFSIITI